MGLLGFDSASRWMSTIRQCESRRVGGFLAEEAKSVTANAFTLARNAIAKAMQSAKIAVSGEPTFA